MAPSFRLLALLPALWALSGQAQLLCCPPHFGGIVPGITLDKHVVLLYGKGFFSDIYGHAGGRIYTDPAHSVTMRVEIGESGHIETVVIEQGLHFPEDAPKDLSPYEITNIDPSDNGRLHQLLGATMEQVRARYGQESSLSDEGHILVYAKKKDAEPEYYEPGVYIHFTDGKADSIAFTSGSD